MIEGSNERRMGRIMGMDDGSIDELMLAVIHELAETDIAAVAVV